MKRFATVRTVAATVALAVVAGITAYAQPKMEIVGGDTHDWGKVSPTKLTTTVELKNVGNAELKISEVRPGCGCTAAPIDKNLLQPGEIGKISITLDVTSRTGPVDKIVTVTSNDSSAPQRVIHLKADVHRAVTCSPMQYLTIADGKLGVESAASPITIKNTGDAPFTIEPPVLGEGGNVAVRFDMSGKKELKPGEEFVLKGYITPKDARTIYGTVKMKTSNSETPSLDIPISGMMAQTTIQTPSTPTSSVPQVATPKNK